MSRFLRFPLIALLLTSAAFAADPPPASPIQGSATTERSESRAEMPAVAPAFVAVPDGTNNIPRLFQPERCVLRVAVSSGATQPCLRSRLL